MNGKFKKNIKISLIVILILIIIFGVAFYLNLYFFIQPVIITDISDQNVDLIEKEFDINIISQAKIVKTSYLNEHFIVQLQANVNIDTFIIQCLKLEDDELKISSIANDINDNNQKDVYTTIDNKKVRSLKIQNSSYKKGDFSPWIFTNIYYQDGVLMAELEKRDSYFKNDSLRKWLQKEYDKNHKSIF